MKLDVNNGIYGPSHDPYSYKERIVFKDTKTIILHTGLDFFVLVKEGKKEEKFGYEQQKTEEEIVEKFEEETGLTPEMFDRSYDRIRYTCKECGNRKSFYTSSGFPGETFLICSLCDSIVFCHFNKSAII